MSHSERRDDDALSAEEVAVLAVALRPERPDDATASRIRARILAGVRAAEAPPAAATDGMGGLDTSPATAFLTIPADGRRWQPVAPGVEMCTLREDAEARSILLRMQPDSILVPHQHAMSEESLILEGDAWIGDDVYLRAGDYHYSPAGRMHPMLRSPGGCIVFVRCDRDLRVRVTPGLVARVLKGMVKRLRG